MPVGRNDPCPCGSGEKYKRCCDRTRRAALSPAAIVLILILVVGGIAAVLALMRAPDSGATGSGRVWSAEHGHWHDASGGETAPAPGAPGIPGAASPAPVAPGPAPAGPAPAGKVWSPEHGHWHDAAPPAGQR